MAIVNVDTNARSTQTTDERGRYRFVGVPVGRYRLTASLTGFATVERTLTVSLGESVDVPITLVVQALAEAITVKGGVAVVELSRTHMSEAVSPAEVQALPLNGRNYLDLALLAPGVSRTNLGSSQRFAETSAVPGTGVSISSQRNLNNAFVVDGLSANDDAAGLAGTFLSQEVIREFLVITSGGSAEFGRASAGTINVATQSGTNTVSGRAYGFFRDDRFDARNAMARAEDPLHQNQYGATLGGPLRRDVWFAFGNVERTHNVRTGFVTIDDRAAAAIDAVLDASGYPGQRVATGAFRTGYDTSNVFLRLDRTRSAASRATLRYSLYDVASPNARTVGALNAPSRGTRLDDRDHAVAVSWMAASTRVFHDIRVQAVRSRLDAAVNDIVGPAVNISGVASFGTSTAAPTTRAADAVQFADSVSVQRGAQLWKAGVDALYNRVTIDFPGALQGTYAFSSLSNFQAGRYITFTQAFGQSRQFQANPNLGLFIQNEWRASDRVAVTAGLRYDLQWLPAPIQLDRDNVSPRVGISWAPGNRRTVVRASAGVFFDRIPLRATSNALQRDGARYKVAVFPFGDPRAPSFPQVIPAFPADLLTSITTIDPRIQNSSSRQAAVQIEHALGTATSVSIGLQRLDGRGLLMSRNVNVPAYSAAEAIARGIPNLGRPDPRYANVTRFESIGRSAFDALTFSVRAKPARWLETRASYTFSKALDDAGNFFFSQPQDANDVHADWGPSDNDQRHRFTFSGSVQGPERRLLRGWQASWLFGGSSALPFNLQTGNDRNNDTVVNDRPAGVTRNSARGFTTATLDVRIGHTWRAERFFVDGLIEGFNLLNRVNYMLPNNVFGADGTPRPDFGRPTAAADPRQIQLAVKLRY